MRIVNIAGGLGNQMFQYAFALMLKKHFPEEEVLVDIHHYNSLMFKKFGSVNLHNGYEINSLFENANLPIASRRQLRQLSRYIPNYVLSRIARKLLPLRPTEFVADYSQNFAYDKRVLREGDTYYALQEYFENVADLDNRDENDDIEILILKRVVEGDEESFDTITDDDLFDKLTAMFDARMDEEEEE